MEQLTQLSITENQVKVIKDKYLKDSPTVESWLRGVAKNIALTEILYSKKISELDIFKNVQYERVDYDFNKKLFKFFLVHKNLRTHPERVDNFKKFMKNLYDIAEKNPELVNEVEEKFYKILSNFEFLPNSPCLMNAGRDLQMLSACFVLPVEDSIDGIFDSVKNAAMVHKAGGGTGFSFSRLRPSGDAVMTTKGVSSGPITFMQIFDKQTQVIKQGSTRRGANMGVLHYTHPDIMEFINMKKTPGVMENFNVSVTVDDAFMQAVRKNEDYELINPKSGKVAGTLNAKEVWKELVKGAWETGDPGIIFIDRMNNPDSNPTPAIGQIESTNPCGEQPLLPYEVCNLGSINLSKFINKDRTDFDYGRLKQCVLDTIHFLDNVIDVNNYPIPEIEEMAKVNRRIGLGIMGWAESLALLNIPYNSEKALNKAEELMKFINDNSLIASEELAKIRGVFPAFNNSVYDKSGNYFVKEKEAYPRNCARTTIAPTGTIAITAGLQGSGIEPFFSLVYVRYNAAALDALRKGEKPEEKDTFFEINPIFEDVAKNNHYFGFSRKELYEKINNNYKSIKGINEIPEYIQNRFLTSHDLSPKDHVLMQCAFQKYTDNAVSKTVNLKNEANEEDVEKVYMLAYENEAKGVTVYRDGSKSFQVLNLSGDKKKEKKELKEFSDYYPIQTGQGPIHIHINYNEEHPTKVFANLTPAGTEISGLTTALAITLSKYFEYGGDPVRILKHLNSIKSEKPYGFGKNRVDSVPHAISIALRNHLIKTGKIKTLDSIQDDKEQQKLVDESQDNGKRVYCPQCFSSNVGMVSGCSEPTCFDCGYSKCS
jgi:ribonucleoside-diphosphate reductase alpha chain